jgi:hypothetical protein
MSALGANLKFVQAEDNLGDPDAAPTMEDAAQVAGTVADILNPPPPPPADNGTGQIILIVGIVVALGVGFLVFKSLRDGAVRQLQDYDKATRTGLIGGGVAAAVIVGLAWFVSRQNF